ncbi:hypothetical protein OESDEN_04013 [Oesophagostomum dentatum]|uniref:Serine carboxypeptidase S28 n=1 Tax=Oesophagostomum dentatum TaxID=61180 RepID=A0A0B1TEQ0_OESDE|nr:hypothetical protein OESDEN_04013 [Oesophagostomum dentatum]
MVLASKLGATVFALEHRYYGDSIVGGWPHAPNPDLKYLSSLQMLHDVAHFIRTMNAEMHSSSPWITFGGAYGGSLSVWMRELFPDLVIGAVASSPILEAKLDFYGSPAFYIVAIISRNFQLRIHASHRKILE